jgi:hypothetical protein
VALWIGGGGRKLLGLNLEQMEMALGMAGTQASGLPGLEP